MGKLKKFLVITITTTGLIALSIMSAACDEELPPLDENETDPEANAAITLSV